MADLQTETGHNRRFWLDCLWLAMFLAALAWTLPDAAAQVGPALTGLPPEAASPVGPALTAPPPNAANPAAPAPGKSPAAASSPDMVVDVRIAGNKALPLDKILPSIRTRTGRPFDLELIGEDVRRLDHTHQFVNVKTYWQKVPGGRVVIFEVLERPLLQEVWFIGCKEIRKRTLQKESELKVGDPADPNAIEEARRKIEELYHKRGFNGARITLMEGDKPQDRRAIFIINEGVKQLVWKREFVGNTIDSGDRLATQISSKPPFLYLFGGEFDRKKVDEDVEKLTAYYRGLGFFRARIGRELKFSEKDNWVTILFVIDEGVRFKVRNVSMIGNKKYASEELLAELKLKNNEYFNQARMTADVQALQDKYGGVGYVFADIKPDPRFLEEPGQLDLVYKISEGDRYRVGKINIQIKGEYSHTQENTVRNRLFFKPGDIVDIRQIRASEVALKRSGLFESNPAQGNAPKVVFDAPGHEGDNPEDDNHQEVAEKPDSGRRPGARFRGQSPDSDSRDRVLDVTLDCGRYIGPREDPAVPASKNQPEVQSKEPPVQRATPPDGSSSLVDHASSDLAQRAQEYSESLARLKEERRPRLQYLAPDDAAEGRPLPRNSAPGDFADPRRPIAAPAGCQQHGEATQDIGRLAREYSEAVSESTTGRRSREGLIPTQYSPDAGQVSPAGQVPLQWSGRTTAAVPNVDNSRPAAFDPTYPSTQPQAPASPAPGNAFGTPPAPVTPAPVAPAAPYGNNMSPRQGPEQPLVTPQGEYMVPGPIFGENSPFRDGPPDGGPPARPLNTGVVVNETMTGRLMFGVGINSDAGLVGSIVLDEQNFDWTKVPTSWEDIRNATAWRGAGQRFRLEAVPGTQVQRYMVTFQEPYMFGTQVSMGLNGYYYNRIYTEYTDQRLGGRIGFGYQFTPALSAGIAYRGAKINITNPIDPALPDLKEVVGRDLALHGFQLSLTHDQRDNAFLATEGHLIEASIEQVLGSFQYPRAELDVRKYFTLYERPDGSGRHVLSLSARTGWTGDDTPIYDRFYAGGFSTLRGFQFRGASPMEIGPTTGQNIVVGGDFQVLASAEYMFPITADDMVRGVVFCDTGTVEPSVKNWADKFRVAPGFGLRICVPAMGPAPIALDFAFPVSWQPGDKSELFSFFVGFGR